MNSLNKAHDIICLSSYSQTSSLAVHLRRTIVRHNLNSRRRCSVIRGTVDKYIMCFFFNSLSFLQRILAFFNFLHLRHDTLKIPFGFFQLGRVTQNCRWMIHCCHPVAFAVYPHAMFPCDFKIGCDKFLCSYTPQAYNHRRMQKCRFSAQIFANVR